MLFYTPTEGTDGLELNEVYFYVDKSREEIAAKIGVLSPDELLRAAVYEAGAGRASESVGLYLLRDLLLSMEAADVIDAHRMRGIEVREVTAAEYYEIAGMTDDDE